MTAVLIVLGVAVVVLLAVTLRLARRGRPVPSDEKPPEQTRSVPAPAANVAVVTRYELWLGRAEQEKLAARSALWEVPETTAGDLLAEVLYAAGGVEREFRELRRALDDGQRVAAQAPPKPTVLLQGEHAPAAQRQPIGGAHAAAAARSVREASYSFVNLLSWARSTVEHADHAAKPGSSARAGLLPALRPGEPHDRVEAALQHLRTALRDTRSRSGEAFHAGAVPDEQPESTEDRDKLTYAAELMAAIEVFVNQLLDALASASAG